MLMAHSGGLDQGRYTVIGLSIHIYAGFHQLIYAVQVSCLSQYYDFLSSNGHAILHDAPLNVKVNS
jgi:thymidylate synthase